MGYYDVTNRIPIDIILKGNVINKEILSLIDYINNNNIDTNNVIFVMDRAYFSYDLFKFLEDKHIKFVIRVKNNCVYVKNKKPKNINNVRFVSYNVDVMETKKDKNNNDKTLMRKLSCYLATNLDITLNDNDIRNIYKSRWDIEVFFKLVKSNFRFSCKKLVRIQHCSKVSTKLINTSFSWDFLFRLILNLSPKLLMFIFYSYSVNF
jgi:IS4 transposase